MDNNQKPFSEEEYLRSKHPSFSLLAPKPGIIAALLLAIAAVSVSGLYAAYAKYKEVASLSAQQNQVQTLRKMKTADTSGWKTYRNDKYGFEFRYPSGWSLTEGTSKVFAQLRDPNNDNSMQISNVQNDYGPPTFGGGIKEVIVGGKVRKDFLTSPDSQLIYFTDESGTGFIMSVNNLNQQVLTTILSTFKFIPSNPLGTGEPVGKALFKKDHFVYIDFSRCEKDNDRFFVAFGSTVISIEGLERNSCVLRYGGEVENPNWDGKLATLCRVPLTEGLGSFTETDYGVDMSSIDKYCEIDSSN